MIATLLKATELACELKNDAQVILTYRRSTSGLVTDSLCRMPRFGM